MEPSRNLTSLLHHSRSIFYIATDIKGRYTYANQLYQKIFFTSQVDRDAIFESSIYPDDLELYQNAVAECLDRPGESVCIDLRKLRSDGSIFWIRWEFSAVIENEQIIGIQAVGTDASERKRAESEKMEIEEKLSTERQLLRTLIDNLPDSIYVKDTASRFVITNRAQLSLIGARSEQEIIGKTVSAYVDEDTASHLTDNDNHLLSTGRALINQEELMVTNNGEKKWLLTTRVPLQKEDDTIIGMVGISRDITDRKQIEESLRRSIERYNIVSRATNDAIWDWDLLTNDILWNDGITTLFGYPKEGDKKDYNWWQEHLHPDDRSRVDASIWEHINQGKEHWQDEYRFVCADGSVKTIFDRGFILFDDQHKPYRMIGAMMDITERKELQEKLAAQSITRQKLVTEATIMAQEKERAEIGRELHDNINQILTTTKMYLDMALNEKDISEELMLKSHENISTAIEEIRALSKSLVPPSLGDIGLYEAIGEIVHNLNLSQKVNVKLSTSGISNAQIPGNVQLMVFRIVQEQVSNILKHSKATHAEIGLTVKKKTLYIKITDNGIGFETRKRVKGIGLMNITSRAELHNGHVDIHSAPGKGCTLKISIPL